MVGLGPGEGRVPQGPWVMFIIPWSINEWIDRGGEHYFVKSRCHTSGGWCVKFTHQSVCTHKIPGT